MCPWKSLLKSLLADKSIRIKWRTMNSGNEFQPRPCNSLTVTSFNMSDEGKGAQKVIVEGESSGYVDHSGATPNVPGIPLSDHFPPDLLPFFMRLFVTRETIGRLEGYGAEVDDASKIISVGGSLSNTVWCESEGDTFEEAIARAGLILDADTVLNSTASPLC